MRAFQEQYFFDGAREWLHSDNATEIQPIDFGEVRSLDSPSDAKPWLLGTEINGSHLPHFSGASRHSQRLDSRVLLRYSS